jgi:hypothetical protein
LLGGKALGQVLRSFFAGSRARLVSALFADDTDRISTEEIQHLSDLLDRLKQERDR